jgi:hypothetical protein
MAKFPKVFTMIIVNFLLTIPLVLFGVFEQSIKEDFFPSNPEVYNYIFGFLIVLVIVPSLIFTFRGFSKYFLGNPDDKRILATGRSARAKLISLGESSEGIVTINDQPLATLTLEVYDGSKPPYQVKIETIIGRLDIPRFQPGVMLAIKIDLQDPQKVVLDPSGAGLQGSANMPTFKAEGISAEEEKLIENGIDAQAKIISIEDTGKTKDFNPVARITYEVHIPGKNPYTLTKNVPMTTEAAQFIKKFVGKNVPAKVHPNNNNRVELKFNPQ